MINTAARATSSVKIPNCRQTRQAIINTFREQLTALQERLMVRHILADHWSPVTPCNLLTYDRYDLQSDKVKGRVSLTCDAWQASNVDGYFAVTGSWIKEWKDKKWELQTALLGFTQLNSVHNGVQLGLALFKIVSRAGIAHKVSHIIIQRRQHEMLRYRLDT